ncbi:hypothetical protein [Caballeronia sordidicola]|uniref:Uncharacterized protein n=1 Tax=Caballeronia sordidicola TaxID=196367 RepID=A0A242N6Z1_CABSO|nr:hypothetical protein [Caballeronia sordidicola]OTP79450.1 hypothetical protein PAMC26577_00885 [Caballeronia sordidicola]
MKTYRPGLPTVPPRMRNLPVNCEGYPVPFVCAWIDGEPNFSIADPRKLAACHDQRWCSLCGELLGQYKAFVLDPVAAVTRISTEPPAHIECARFAAAALSRAFVTLVWVTRGYSLERINGKTVFRIGEPEQTFWYAGGLRATRQEVMDSMQAALPAMYALAHEEGEATVMELDLKVARATRHFPKNTTLAHA